MEEGKKKRKKKKDTNIKNGKKREKGKIHFDNIIILLKKEKMARKKLAPALHVFSLYSLSHYIVIFY